MHILLFYLYLLAGSPLYEWCILSRNILCFLYVSCFFRYVYVSFRKSDVLSPKIPVIIIVFVLNNEIQNFQKSTYYYKTNGWLYCWIVRNAISLSMSLNSRLFVGINRNLKLKIESQIGNIYNKKKLVDSILKQLPERSV